MYDDASISHDDDQKRNNVQKDHAHEEIKKLLETRTETAKGDTLLVPRKFRMVLHVKNDHLR